MRGEGFIRSGYEMRYLVAERVEDIIPMILSAAKRARENAEADKEVAIERF
jgi:hypothetical protein